MAVLDPEAAKLAYDRVCRAASVEVLLHTLVIEASRDGDRITSVTLHDHRGAREVSAKAFVDASGEADLAFFGGASTRYGSHGFAQTGTLGVRFGGIAPDADISAERWTEAVGKAKARGVAPLAKEKSVLIRLPISNDVMSLIVDEDYDARDAASVSAAEASGREQARAYLTAIRELPGHERAYIASTGPHFGTRESRHVDAVYQLKEDDVQKAARFDDSVALGAWPMEYHPGKGNEDIWRSIDNEEVYEIPLRTLRSRDTSNLFAAGRLADGERLAGSSMRVMGTSFATGQACGVASARYANVGAVDVADVRKTLEAQDTLIDGGDLPDPISLDAVVTV